MEKDMNVNGEDMPQENIADKSNLKMPHQEVYQENTQVYSDEDLEEFRQIVALRMQETQVHLDDLHKQMRYQDNGTEDTGHAFNMIEDSQVSSAREENAIQINRLERYMNNLRNALLRIQNKNYGRCRRTGVRIPKERLLVMPHVTTCVEAKLELTRLGKNHL